ncbi:MAG: hypothetical protein AAF494_01030 [Pseudomonadota bacterium]
MNAHLARFVVFFGAIALGVWGFIELSLGWGIASLVAAFLIGSAASGRVFKRLASDQQIKDDLEARLHND